jgi:hypothetical protein
MRSTTQRPWWRAWICGAQADEFRHVRFFKDVFPLHALRVVLDLAGLIKRRSGKLSLAHAQGRCHLTVFDQ